VSQSRRTNILAASQLVDGAGVNKQAGKRERKRGQTGKRGSKYTGKLVKRGSMHREPGNKRDMRGQLSKRDSMHRQTGNSESI